MTRTLALFLLALSGWLPLAAGAQASEPPRFQVTRITCGLEHPWSLAFLPDGRMLVSERPGRLRLISPEGRLSPPIQGLPPVHAQGQGGLLDIALSPRFATDKTLFFSYAQPSGEGARTAVARAELDLENQQLKQLRLLFAQQEDPAGKLHWGSRLVFGRDGHLFITTGDRYHLRDQAQNLDSHLGKVLRITTEGGIPADNPYRNRKGARPEIWSYGHRNVQGAALHPQTGELWTHEHGPQGGDEVNLTLPGRNHGWPVITHGKEYVTGRSIGAGSSRADVAAPLWQWTPSIAPSGMAFYTGSAFPAWQGSLFVGALRGQMLVRLELEGNRVVREERLLTDLGRRIRDVRQGPDGKLWLLEESEGCLLRLDPAQQTAP